MNYKKESQFTNNASKRVFEEVYTNEDMPDDRVDNGSYRLSVPQMFSSNLSQEKAISPRRVICEPKPHIFNLGVIYYCDNHEYRTQLMEFDFISSNTIEEILHEITNRTIYDDDTEHFKLMYTYNKLKGILSIIAESKTYLPTTFKFVCPDYDDYVEFWSMLNQVGAPLYITETNPDYYDENSTSEVEMYRFFNVWSREPLYVHASFSSSKKHYLCRTGDFWFKPSKYYYDNTNQNDFELFFTTDGNNRIIPYDAVKVIELCFILRQFARL